jgi:hypothetical protein
MLWLKKSCFVDDDDDDHHHHHSLQSLQTLDLIEIIPVYIGNDTKNKICFKFRNILMVK